MTPTGYASHLPSGDKRYCSHSPFGQNMLKSRFHRFFFTALIIFFKKLKTTRLLTFRLYNCDTMTDFFFLKYNIKTCCSHALFWSIFLVKLNFLDFPYHCPYDIFSFQKGMQFQSSRRVNLVYLFRIPCLGVVLKLTMLSCAFRLAARWNTHESRVNVGTPNQSILDKERRFLNVKTPFNSKPNP